MHDPSLKIFMKNDETTLSAGRQHANPENNRGMFQTVSLSGYAEGSGVLAEERKHRKPLVMRSLRLGFSGNVTRSKSGDSFLVDKLTSNSKVFLVELSLGTHRCQWALRICASPIIQAGALVVFTCPRKS